MADSAAARMIQSDSVGIGLPVEEEPRLKSWGIEGMVIETGGWAGHLECEYQPVG